MRFHGNTPVSTDARTPLDDPAPPGSPPADILIVDDDQRNLTVLEAVLDGPGYRLVRAASARDALLALMTHEFACILLDVQMQEMTGFELAQMIKARPATAQVPIIFLTAYFNEEHHVLEGYASGAVDYLHKPFNPAVLRQKVEVFVELHRMHQELRAVASEREQLARTEAARAAAVEGRRRADFLAEASRLLSLSLDFEDTIATTLELCVPMLGTEAFLVLAGSQSVRQRQMQPATPGQEAQPLSAGLREICDRAARDGHFRTWPSGDRAAAICPLVVGKASHGVLAVLGAAHGFDESRVELVREVAGRAAIAMENSRLHAEVKQADRRKSELVAMLAHELRNPLAPITNAVRILQDPTASPSITRWAHDVIGRQVGHLARLLGDLLDASRFEQGKVLLRREALPLEAIVEGAIESSEPQVHARKQAIDVQLPPPTIEIQGDAVRLMQALSNLIDNASKFSPPGATIRIAASRTEGHVRISVKDEGVGIAREFLPHVFELFAQGEQSLDRPLGGLGVGLTLVKAVIELHGGCVAVHSEGRGKGTEAVVQLPARVRGTMLHAVDASGRSEGDSAR